jgi:hypothetical protein
MRKRRRVRLIWRLNPRRGLAVLVLVGLTACSQAPSQASNQSAGRSHTPEKSPHELGPLAGYGGAVTAPSQGIYLGAFDNAEGQNGTADGGMGVYTQLQSLEGQIHRKFAIDLHYSSWTGALASQSVIADLSAGRIPLISWQCGAPDASVAAGIDDKMIASQATAIAELRRPVMIRWFWEMEYTGNNGGKQGANAASCIGSAGPAGYIAAWRHIVTIFREKGATNVSWVFCPGESSYGPAASARGLAASRYYPGNDFVDWIGEDAYSRATLKTLPSLASGMYREYGNSGKPLIICETGAEGPDQPAFLKSAEQLPADYPNLKAVVYFDSHGPLGTYVFTPQGLAAFGQLSHAPSFSVLPPAGE